MAQIVGNDNFSMHIAPTPIYFNVITDQQKIWLNHVRNN